MFCGRAGTENFMPSAGGGLVEFFASASEDPRPQDVNSVISLNLAIFLMTLKHNI